MYFDDGSLTRRASRFRRRHFVELIAHIPGETLRTLLRERKGEDGVRVIGAPNELKTLEHAKVLVSFDTRNFAHTEVVLVLDKRGGMDWGSHLVVGMKERRSRKGKSGALFVKFDSYASIFLKISTMPPKATIPKALREQVWIKYAGPKFQTKCPIPWCANLITVFDFEVGHNIPESKGGSLEITNLLPLCGRCNRSMSDNYTIDEWAKLVVMVPVKKRWWCC